MKLKLDENLGHRVQNLLQDAGHDVATVHEQRLAGAHDPVVIDACRTEERALITLDLEFGNPFLFRPRDYAGIAVIRLPRRAPTAIMERAIEKLIDSLSNNKLSGKLWIVEPHCVRVYRPEDEDDWGGNGKETIYEFPPKNAE